MKNYWAVLFICAVCLILIGVFKAIRWVIQICVILLILIAAVVAVLLILGIPAWFVIICYWVVLTGKNACDLMVLRNGTSG